MNRNEFVAGKDKLRTSPPYVVKVKRIPQLWKLDKEILDNPAIVGKIYTNDKGKEIYLTMLSNGEQVELEWEDFERDYSLDQHSEKFVINYFKELLEKVRAEEWDFVRRKEQCMKEIEEEHESPK